MAGEFIKNVSSTFTGATAQVASSQKYVIRGIRARKVPVDSGITPGSRPSDKGRELLKCCWKVQTIVDGRDQQGGAQNAPSVVEKECSEWFRTSDDILKHVLATHLRLPIKKAKSPEADAVDKMEVDSPSSRPASRPTSTAPNGLTNGTGVALPESFDFEEADKSTYKCKWADCTRSSADFDASKTPRTVLFVRHVQTHLPSNADPSVSKHNIRPDAQPRPLQIEGTFLTTITDEKGDAAGVPLGAALVLRNIAKFFPRPPQAPTNGIAVIVGGKRNLEAEHSENDLLRRVFDDEVPGEAVPGDGEQQGS